MPFSKNSTHLVRTSRPHSPDFRIYYNQSAYFCVIKVLHEKTTIAYKYQTCTVAQRVWQARPTWYRTHSPERPLPWMPSTLRICSGSWPVPRSPSASNHLNIFFVQLHASSILKARSNLIFSIYRMFWVCSRSLYTWRISTYCGRLSTFSRDSAQVRSSSAQTRQSSCHRTRSSSTWSSRCNCCATRPGPCSPSRADNARSPRPERGTAWSARAWKHSTSGPSRSRALRWLERLE